MVLTAMGETALNVLQPPNHPPGIPFFRRDFAVQIHTAHSNISQQRSKE
jgi:hypothetical protein